MNTVRREHASARAQLTYAFDAYCGWCYGFSLAMQAFTEANAHRIEVRVLSGGLFTGPRALPVAAYPHIPSADQRIARLTGVTFGDGYRRELAAGAAVLDSFAAATGLVALRSQPGADALRAARAMQRAWYVEGRSLSDVQVYRDIAVEQGLDPDSVSSAWASPASRDEAEADFRAVRRLGVDGYPTLLLHTPHGTDRIGGPVSSADALTRALDQHLAAAVD
ncbi:DsbA family protein [Actinacidiphila glaucinigra]|uniref:DsbA family protein n=1 Tax=Actinacidiphila glaucinigra TaxID=235986 RepID=UPI0029AB0423|nr:DsbA family protein [Streptomyces sp. PA03-3a]